MVLPEEFAYLVSRDRGTDRGPAVEDKYTRSTLANRMVVRDELNNRFLVFPSQGDFVEWGDSVPPPERCFHEVVFGHQPQRLKFDIDMMAYKLDAVPEGLTPGAMVGAEDVLDDDSSGSQDGRVGAATPASFDSLLDGLFDDGGCGPAPSLDRQRRAKAELVVECLIEAVLDELYVAYRGAEDLAPTRGHLAVTDSSGPVAAGWKFSYHVVVLPWAVPDAEEAREFTARVCERLPPILRGFIDTGVNKRIQNFRCPGSAKPGTNRFKTLTPAFGTCVAVPPSAMLVAAPPGTRVLARVYTDGPAPVVAPVETNSAAVAPALAEAARLGLLEGHTFLEARGRLLCFRRCAPSYCRRCEEVHHRDNSLMLSYEPDEAGHEGSWPRPGAAQLCRLYEHCRQRPGSVLVGTFRVEGGLGASAEAFATAKAKPATESASGPAHDRVRQRVEDILGLRVQPHAALASGFEQLPPAQQQLYAEPTMRPYELVPTLAVQAQMKLGKTKALRAWLDDHFPRDGFVPSVVRFVTFRQTFSQSLVKAFPDFLLYSDVAGDLDPVRHPRLIVQVESLHRLRMPTNPEPVDVLVLDEVESILAQFSSGLHRQLTASFAMFQWMMATARHVVCMDANLSDRTYNCLLRLRPQHPPRFHWNRHLRAADDQYFFTADQGAWLAQLWAQLREGKRVVLPTNSLAEAKAFDEALRREFPAKRVMLYSSETAPTEKARHFADVHTHWGDLDVLIYTPTCSAGVSFELPWFDVLFGYFTDQSCDVETCRQMLGRVRAIGDSALYICLRAVGPPPRLPTTTEEIRRRIFDKRAGLYRRLGEAAPLQFEYAPDGEVRHYESNYFHCWLETVRMDNLSRNQFVERFIDQVADSGAGVRLLPAAAPEDEAGAALLADHRALKLEQKAAHHTLVAAAPELSPDEAAAVRDSFQRQEDVPASLRLGYELYQLRDHYTWHGRPVDAAFVEAYAPWSARRCFRGLAQISEGPTVLASLELMRAREAGHYSALMASRPADTAAATTECRDLVWAQSTYVYTAHRYAVHLLLLAGFRSVVDRGHVHARTLEARFRAALPALRAELDRIVFEFGVPRPGLDRLARDEDPRRFTAGVLRFVNAVLRIQYGLEIKRVPKRAGESYFLNPTAEGRLFMFPDSAGSRPDSAADLDDPPVPVVPSNLLPVPAPHLRVTLAVSEQYWDLKPEKEHAVAMAAAEAEPVSIPEPGPETDIPAEEPFGTGGIAV